MAKRKEFDLSHMNEESMRQLERKISGIYRDAAKDIRVTVNAYWHGDEKTKGYDARLAEMQARLDAGEITQEYFRLWQRNQLGRGERWEAMKSNVCSRTAQANQIAAAYVNGSTPAIYALNANHTAYQIESRRDEFPDVDFALIDERTVRELASGANHQEFRTLSVNPKRDYNWNSSQIERALTVGIINGDSITHMTDRFMNIMGNNHKAALRNARTAVTSAENAGQHRTMQAAQDMGIDVSKEWSSLPDDRTRESHFLLDGIRAALDEPFPNGLMYPADPAGHPSEVYNCRCTMMNILKGINDYVRIGGEASGGDEKISYEEWLRQKEDAGLMPQYDENGAFSGGNNPEDVEQQMDGTEDQQEEPEEQTFVPDSLHPQTVGGVERTVESMSFEEADTYSTNPKFGDDRQYQINCQTCVVANEARRRGYDVEAMGNFAGSVSEIASSRYEVAWIDPATGDHPRPIFNTAVKTAARAYTWLSSLVQVGERYTIRFTWRGQNSGHIINMDKTDDGVLRFHDNQLDNRYDNDRYYQKYHSEQVGKEQIVEYLKQVRISGEMKRQWNLSIDENGNKTKNGTIEWYPGIQVLRIDDKEFYTPFTDRALAKKK